MMKRLLYISFFALLCALVLALAFTIIGSSTSHDSLLNAGIVLWLSCSALFFVWVVLIIWSRIRKYGE